MKKIILGLGLVAGLLASCSSDSDAPNSNPTGPNDILVKSIVYTSITDDYSETVVYTYNGKKLLKGVYTDGSEEIYYYEGNLITKMEIVEDDEITYTETFEYDSSNRLTSYTVSESGFTDTETYVYNSNGTVTASQGLIGFSTLTYLNDEVITVENSVGTTYNYTYDGKYSPFRNVTGYDKIARVVQGDHEFFGSKKNITSIYETSEDTDYMTNTITYNANNYPVSVNSIAIFEFGTPSSATIQYTYY